jgi:hypothetical protein
MGYSGRYHAASLAAVFIALAIGILIGIGLADDVVSSASQELESSLRDERDAAQQRADDLQADLDQERQFSEGASGALVAGKLTRQKVAVIYLGNTPSSTDKDTANAAIDAIGPSGAGLGSVSSITLPADVGPLIDATGRRFSAARRDPIALRDLGRLLGAGVIGGRNLIERVKPDLFTSFNGTLDGVSRVILINNRSDEMSSEDAAAADAFERGLLEGLAGAARGVAGVELTSTDPTTLSVFSDAGLATVDDVDRPAGQVALVYALNGVVGDFGVKDGADSLVPDLLPTSSTGP